ncbi:hypothetical protein DOTSEDRAFT_87280 [Dothistroma septosporum NZE10]|uniref:FAD-binding PCMH-type domain-containing protein n=1 Tax=Dothistroma septosporum (strain NZE10 / CBS 128990) TaxID=675120 RepID=N1PTY7_DOTSN|nr:hypothetical protein DOTSEDRAFT_87280 [Dothistroma septosporum NZE10]
MLPTRSTTPFEKCIAQAFGEDSSLYTFRGDLISDLPLVDGLPYLNNLESEHPYNLDHPVTPAAIVFPRDAQQVSAAVMCARKYGIAVSSRSGGHSYTNAGLGGMDGALSIDYQNMKAFSYDPQDQTMTFESGSRLADLDRNLAPTGRVAAYGAVGSIGTGGHFTIGGLGALSRLLGLAADQIVSAECVLADGTVATVSADKNTDLFFAIKGAAWSFASVTSFKVATSPAPSSVISFQYNITFSRIADLADSFSQWQELVSQPDLTRKFASTLTLAQDLLVYSGTFFGDRSDFDRLNLEGLLPHGQEHLDITVVSSVVTHAITDLIKFGYDIFGSLPAHFYAKSLKFTRQTLFSSSAVQELFQYLDTIDKGTLVWFIVWDLNGGAISDIPQDGTAYWHRDALFFQQGYVVNEIGPVTQQSRDFLTGLTDEIHRLQPRIDDSAYPGYVDAELENPLRAYWGGNVERLIQIKGEYDPDDVFRNGQSVAR